MSLKHHFLKRYTAAHVRCLLVFVFVSLCFSTSFAQDTAQVHAIPEYTIHRDEALSELLDKYIEYNGKREFGDGFRIQIMYTNVREEAYNSKGVMYVEFPELTSYVDYEPPYYKLRIGDFKDRLEATYYLQKVVSVYPGAFIVKDKIKIK